jgi:hypothetical protein
MGLISREEFITYMLDNRARAFPYIQKSWNKLYIRPSFCGNAERTELSINMGPLLGVCPRSEWFVCLFWTMDDFGVKGSLSFFFFF